MDCACVCRCALHKGSLLHATRRRLAGVQSMISGAFYCCLRSVLSLCCVRFRKRFLNVMYLPANSANTEHLRKYERNKIIILCRSFICLLSCFEAQHRHKRFSPQRDRSALRPDRSILHRHRGLVSSKKWLWTGSVHSSPCRC